MYTFRIPPICYVIATLLITRVIPYEVQIEEIHDKIAIQLIGFYKYVSGTEENYQDRMHLQVKYFLYQREEYLELKIGDVAQLTASNFNKTLPTILIIHGYTDDKDRGSVKTLRQAIINNLDVNTIVVDWSLPAKQFYFTSISNIYPVGKQLASFLKYLASRDVALSTVHLIGHSLGAHVAGITGEILGGKLGRITGLDPAGPMFEFLGEQNTSMSLDINDAVFVDVIHTAIGSFGVSKPIGHTDFYPNFGESPQPGCQPGFLSFSCSHLRSLLFFAESINGTTKFLGKRCSGLDFEDCSREDLIPMGYHTPKSSKGIFYLQSRDKPPFALGNKFYKII